jgi:hypothetical protein
MSSLVTVRKLSDVRRRLFLLKKMAKSGVWKQKKQLFLASAENSPATRAWLGFPKGSVSHTGAHALFETESRLLEGGVKLFRQPHWGSRPV